MLYSPVLCDARWGKRAFSAHANPNSMLASLDCRSSFTFGTISSEVEDALSSTLIGCQSTHTSSEAMNIDEWFESPQHWASTPNSPLLSDLSPFSSASSSTTSREVSPFSLTPKLAQMQFVSESAGTTLVSTSPCVEQEPQTINPSSLIVPSKASRALHRPQDTQFSAESNIPKITPMQILARAASRSSSPLPPRRTLSRSADKDGSCSDSLSCRAATPELPATQPLPGGGNSAQFPNQRLESEGGRLQSPEFEDMRTCPCESEKVDLDMNNYRMIVDSVEDQVAHDPPIEPSHEQDINNLSGFSDKQDSQSHLVASQIDAGLALDSTSVRTYSTRRAASATMRRLAALFEQEKNNRPAVEEKTRRSSARTKKTRSAVCSRSTRSRATQKTQKRSSVGASRFKSSTSRVTRAYTYTCLLREKHPYTFPAKTKDYLYSPLECMKCHVGFKRKPDLLRHLDTTHQRRYDLQCPICTTWFSSRGDALKRHMERGTCEEGKPRKRRKQNCEPNDGRVAWKEDYSDESDESDEDYGNYEDCEEED